MVLSSSGWRVMVMKSIDLVPCRSVLEPQTSHRTGLPTDGHDQAKEWGGSVQHSVRTTGPLEGSVMAPWVGKIGLHVAFT